MSVVPGTLETEQQPPMTVPLRHFVLGLGFLLLGILVGGVITIGIAPNSATLAHVHLLLAGWICLTIMGAMTQFIPVWSGVKLHSQRLATIQLWPVVVGVGGFAGSLLVGAMSWLLVFGALMLLGFLVFVYNIARTLWQVESYDVTERHFATALGFFLLLTTLGYLLAIDLVQPIFLALPLTRPNVVAAHATLAVFGAVLTTVLGALYQLGTMFTQTELHGIDNHLQTIEEVAYPIGVLLLAAGRLLELGTIGRIGGVLAAGSLLGFSVILARRLYETQVDWTPMLSRYAVAASLMALWSALALVAWIRDPLASTAVFGAPGSVHLLGFGVIGFVVLGTLYHIVPFIIWVHRYSDQLGFDDVPMIDDLYNDRIATVDFSLLTGGLLVLIGTDLVNDSVSLTGLAAMLVVVGAILFVANMLIVIRDHSPYSLGGVLFTTIANHQAAPSDDSERSDIAP